MDQQDANDGDWGEWQSGYPVVKDAVVDDQKASGQLANVIGALSGGTGASNAIYRSQLVEQQRKLKRQGIDSEPMKAAQAKLIGVPVVSPGQSGQFVMAPDSHTGNNSLQFVRSNEAMHQIQGMLGKFFQFQGDRSKPLQQNLSMTGGMGMSGATTDTIMQMLSNPDQVPNADNIPGSISNLNPEFQEKARQFRTFIEGMPVTAVRELRHPKHMYEQVPRDPLINMIHLDSQRRRVEDFYAFI